MDSQLKWIRSNMSIDSIPKDSRMTVKINNSGDLAIDFNKYAVNFFDAAECIIHYLAEDASQNQDISKLDIWYFAMVYLYRQSLELLVKANIFKHVINDNDRKLIIGNIRHDLKEGFDSLLTILNLNREENENIKWLWEYFSDISQIDKESDMFRYPFGANLRTLFDKQTHISLVATHDNMNKANSILTTLYNFDIPPTEKYKANSPKLIIEGGHYYQQSVVGYKYSKHAFYPVFSSYEETGEFLKANILKENKHELFMPMCYMYRNAVELGLKRLIIEDSHIERVAALKVVQRKKHNILGLWNSIASEVKKYANAPDGDTTLEDVQMYIQTFHNFDQTSDLFRYPCDKNLKVYFQAEKEFDVENVASCFQELCNFLDGVDSMLEQVKDYEAEMASYYQENDYY